MDTFFKASRKAVRYFLFCMIRAFFAVGSIFYEVRCGYEEKKNYKKDDREEFLSELVSPEIRRVQFRV